MIREMRANAFLQPLLQAFVVRLVGQLLKQLQMFPGKQANQTLFFRDKTRRLAGDGVLPSRY